MNERVHTNTCTFAYTQTPARTPTPCVSVGVQKENRYFHPDLEYRTYVGAKGDDTDIFGRFGNL